MRHPAECLLDIVHPGRLSRCCRRGDSIQPKQSTRLPNVAPTNQRPPTIDTEECHRVDRSLCGHALSVAVLQTHHDLIPHRILDRRTNTRIALRWRGVEPQPFTERTHGFPDRSIQRVGQLSHRRPRRAQIRRTRRSVQCNQKADDLLSQLSSKVMP